MIWHVTAQDVGRDHPREVDGILGASVRRRVAKLSLFQVVDGEACLDGHGEGIDPFRNAILAQHLRAEQASVGFSKEDFDGEHLGARIVFTTIAGQG